MPSAAPDLVIQDLVVTGDGNRKILEIPALEVPGGSVVGIQGPSGAGKSTLLLTIAGLVARATGQVTWGGRDILGLRRAARAGFRRQSVGLIFQDFLLFDELSGPGNAGLAALYAPRAGRAALQDEAERVLKHLGLTEPRRAVAGFSGGERQRVAVARALAHRPPIILADEPTASLDQTAGDALIDDLLALARDEGRTLIVVSHDKRLLGRLDRVITIAGGRLATPDLGVV